MKIYIFIFLIIFNLKLFSIEIKLKYIKSYTNKISSYNTNIYKIKENKFLALDSERDNSLLITNINTNKESIIDLGNLNHGRILYLKDNLISIQFEEFIPYIFDEKDNNFSKRYNENIFYFKNNALFYKNNYISDIFMQMDIEKVELISADNAIYIKEIKDKVLYIKNFNYEGLNDLWIYDINNKSNFIISDNTEGYIILNDNLFLICRNSEKAEYGHVYPEYYLIDSQGYIKGKFDKNYFNNLYFHSGEIINNKYLILAGSNDKDKGILLYEYKIIDNKKETTNEKIVNNILFKTNVNNLRLRSDPKLDSIVFHTLNKGEWVRILDKGEKVTIDGITGNWVKVFTRYSAGWCFDAYLEEVKE